MWTYSNQDSVTLKSQKLNIVLYVDHNQMGFNMKESDLGQWSGKKVIWKSDLEKWSGKVTSDLEKSSGKVIWKSDLVKWSDKVI